MKEGIWLEQAKTLKRNLAVFSRFDATPEEMAELANLIIKDSLSLIRSGESKKNRETNLDQLLKFQEAMATGDQSFENFADALYLIASRVCKDALGVFSY